LLSQPNQFGLEANAGKGNAMVVPGFSALLKAAKADERFSKEGRARHFAVLFKDLASASNVGIGLPVRTTPGVCCVSQDLSARV